MTVIYALVDNFVQDSFFNLIRNELNKFKLKKLFN